MSRGAPTLAQQVSRTAIGNLYTPLASLITAPLLAHALGVDDRGRVAAATAPLFLVAGMMTLGLPEAVTNAIAGCPRRTRQFAVFGLIGTSCIGFASAAVTWHLSAGLAGGDSVTASLVRLAAVWIPSAMALTAARAAAAGAGAWTEVMLERMIAASVRVMGLLALFLTDSLDATRATAIISASGVLGCVAYLPLCIRRTSGAEGDMADVRHEPSVWSLTSYAARMWIGVAGGMLLSRVDQVLMTPLSGARQLGLYVVAVSTSELSLLFNSAVRDVIFSKQSRDADEQELGTASRISTIGTAVCALALGIASPFAIPLAFGGDFSDAVIPTLILLVAAVAGNPGSVAGAGLSARGRPGLRSLSLTFGCIVNIVLLFLLAPNLGGTGAAIATLVGNLVAAGLNLVWLSANFGLRPHDFLRIRLADLRASLMLACALMPTRKAHGAAL